MIRFSVEQALLIHKYLIEVSGGAEGLRDKGALESALDTPFQTFGGEDLYPGKEQKAAALCFGLIQNHPFIPQRSESSGSITMVPLPSECRESKVRYPAPWGGKRRQRLLDPGLALGY